MAGGKDEQDWCQWPRCKNPSTIVYISKGLCDKHWDIGAELSIDELRKKLKLPTKKEEKNEHTRPENSEGREANCESVEQGKENS